MLSIIILTNNDEAIIADTLDSVKALADQLIIVDSKSTDRTPDIARRMDAEVYTRAFDNFSAQRNFAFQKAKGDWVLFLDSDEQSTVDFAKEVQKTMQEYESSSKIGGYFIRRKTMYFGKDWGFTDKVQRLFIKKYFKKWSGVVHETPEIHGEFGEINSPILHFTHRNITHMVEKTNRWSEYEAELRFTTGHPMMNPLRFIRVMMTGFYQSYIQEKGYKNGTAGVVEGIYQAFSMFVTYAKLWEKQVDATSRSTKP